MINNHYFYIIIGVLLDGHEESNASSSSLRSYEPTVMQKEDVITTFGGIVCKSLDTAKQLFNTCYKNILLISDDSKKAKELNNQLTEQLKSKFHCFISHLLNLCFITVFKEEINKLTADKKLLEKSLEIEKKISKSKSSQIQSGYYEKMLNFNSGDIVKS